jgi:phospholipid transport system transporter-binding protein
VSDFAALFLLEICDVRQAQRAADNIHVELGVSAPRLFEDASALLEQSIPLLMAGGRALELDLSEVAEADSSAISLMLEWLRVANGRQIKLRYSHLPKALLSLADLYGVLEMIPQSAHAKKSAH